MLGAVCQPHANAGLVRGLSQSELVGGNGAKRRHCRVPGALVEGEREELSRLRREVSELRMQRDVLKRSVVLWVDEAMGRRS